MNGKINIHVNVTDSCEVDTGTEKICLVLFDGFADGELFCGKILPGGVDRQHYCENTGSLSARYILDGKDLTGENCRIYIENNGDPFSGTTSPVIRTDSHALKYLENTPLIGKMKYPGGKLVIEISELSESFDIGDDAK